jgi:hypothetical protein
MICHEPSAARVRATVPPPSAHLRPSIANTISELPKLWAFFQVARGRRILALLALVLGLYNFTVFAASPTSPSPTATVPLATGGTPDWRLLFSSPEDIVDPWGKLTFGATALRKLRDCPDPGFDIIYTEPAPDGAWTVFGFRAFGTEHHRTWKLFRATTRDATKYENREVVMEGPVGDWTENVTLAYNPDAKEYFLLNLKIVDFGFQYTASFSGDGRHWQTYDKNPLFYGGDAISVFWSPVLHRFICVSKSFQAHPKRNPDHGGPDRRVLMMRSSVDGRHWEPDISLKDVWNRAHQKENEPTAFQNLPDAEDPPDMEFYSGNGFWYYDRSFLMVLNYAPSPLLPHKHGPQLDTEWWLSRDGLRWERPYRGVNALGDVFPDSRRISSNPMVVDGKILFVLDRHIIGMDKDRLTFVSARANGEFSTRPFVMPAAGLLLNAAAPSPDRRFAASQSYIMVAALDDKGTVIPGFEAAKCLIQNADRIGLPIVWSGADASQLVGRKVTLRFSLRGANIYAVTTAP